MLTEASRIEASFQRSLKDTRPSMLHWQTSSSLSHLDHTQPPSRTYTYTCHTHSLTVQLVGQNTARCPAHTEIQATALSSPWLRPRHKIQATTLYSPWLPAQTQDPGHNTVLSLTAGPDTRSMPPQHYILLDCRPRHKIWATAFCRPDTRSRPQHCTLLDCRPRYKIQAQT